MSHSDEIAKRLQALKVAAQEFNQMLSLIDGNFDARLSEIKSLEMKRDRMKEEIDETYRKAQGTLQDAVDESSKMKKDALSVMSEAREAQNQAKLDKEDAIRTKQEAQAILTTAIQRQKEADVQYKIYTDRLETLKKAVSA